MSLLNALPGAVAQGLVWAIMAIGLYITFRILDFADLSVDGSIVTGACVCAVMIADGHTVAFALLCSFLAGALAGLVTGIFHTVFGIPGVLSGILTQLMLWSINLKILGKANLALPARKFNLLVSQLKILPAIGVLLLAIALVIAALYWFFGTERGCSIRATGNNPQMSRAQGINVELNKIFALMISNGIVALAGAFLAQYQGFADINMGRGAIVIGLAAVIMGEGIVSKISRNFAFQLLGVAFGSVLYFTIYQTVIWLGLDPDLLKMLSAIVVAIFLAIPYWKKKYFSTPKKKTHKEAHDA